MCKGFRKHIRVWALCLATLFAAYYATTALFTHVHVVNGVMLVHSHPFSHSHSVLPLQYCSTFLKVLEYFLCSTVVLSWKYWFYERVIY